MMTDPKAYAQQMLSLFNGDHDAAKIELYNASRAYPQVPCRFFFDVAAIIDADKKR